MRTSIFPSKPSPGLFLGLKNKQQDFISFATSPDLDAIFGKETLIFDNDWITRKNFIRTTHWRDLSLIFSSVL